ncbi:MAG: hypothetical protein H0X25_15815 [Acidobacteriales bacterium]|nr:hypothetical protein [Terriglobales bacterium]
MAVLPLLANRGLQAFALLLAPETILFVVPGAYAIPPRPLDGPLFNLPDYTSGRFLCFRFGLTQELQRDGIQGSGSGRKTPVNPESAECSIGFLPTGRGIFELLPNRGN